VIIKVQIQPYDILLYKGASIIAKAIQFVTKSEYSHCAISLNEDFHLAEALDKGIMITHLQDLPSGYDVYRYKETLTNEQKDKLHEFILLKVSTKYNYEEIFAELLHKELGLHIPVVDGKLICSQFVYMAYLYCGIELLPNFKDCIVSPADLSKSELLVKVNK